MPKLSNTAFEKLIQQYIVPQIITLICFTCLGRSMNGWHAAFQGLDSCKAGIGNRKSRLAEAHFDSICLCCSCLCPIHVALLSSCLRAGQQLCQACTHAINGCLYTGLKYVLLWDKETCPYTFAVPELMSCVPDPQGEKQGLLLSPDVPGCA